MVFVMLSSSVDLKLQCRLTELTGDVTTLISELFTHKQAHISTHTAIISYNIRLFISSGATLNFMKAPVLYVDCCRTSLLAHCDFLFFLT